MFILHPEGYYPSGHKGKLSVNHLVVLLADNHQQFSMLIKMNNIKTLDRGKSSTLIEYNERCFFVMGLNPLFFIKRAGVNPEGQINRAVTH